MSTRREQIQRELEKVHKQRGVGTLESQQVIAALTLQILLDIRDLLQSLQPPTIIATGGESDGRNQRLHSENHQHS